MSPSRKKLKMKQSDSLNLKPGIYDNSAYGPGRWAEGDVLIKRQAGAPSTLPILTPTGIGQRSLQEKIGSPHFFSPLVTFKNKSCHVTLCKGTKPEPFPIEIRTMRESAYTRLRTIDVRSLPPSHGTVASIFKIYCWQCPFISGANDE